MDRPESSRERILYLLKTKGALLASELADKLAITAVGVREQLAQLEAEGLIEGREERRPKGRPGRRWHLTAAAAGHFPESYGDLALDLLGSAREAFGAEGLEQLVAARTKRQLAGYREQMPAADQPLSKRISALCRLRTREGYMAEWRRRGEGFVLIENNCPICAIAQVCQGICGAELELFGSLLGPSVEIRREEHILEGERRCLYRIEPIG